jgi:hypothetical protein
MKSDTVYSNIEHKQIMSLVDKLSHQTQIRQALAIFAIH